MNKFFILIGILFASLLFTGFTPALASDDLNEVGELPKAGITPESRLYSFDKFFERVSLKLTFSDEKRVEKLSRIAEERLAELNELDGDAADKYSDELFNEYGLSVEKANIYLQKLVSEGKISEKQVAKLQNRVEKAEAKQQRINAEANDKISDEVKEQVRNAIRNAKMAIFNRFTNIDEIEVLHEEGYGYGELLKLQAISELTGNSIDVLLAMNSVVTTDNTGEKQINFEVLLTTYGLTQEQVNEVMSGYRTELKEEMKTQLSEIKENAENRLNEMKEKALQNRKNK